MPNYCESIIKEGSRMYRFKEQMSKELRHIEKLQRDVRKYDARLLQGSLKWRKNKSGKVILYLEKSKKTGKKRKKWIQPLGTSDSAIVREIAEARYLDRLSRCLAEDRLLLIKMLDKYKDYDYKSISGSMPRVYDSVIFEGRMPRITDSEQLAGVGSQNPREFKVRHMAVNGVPVRSKNEALIYNMLYFYDLAPAYEQRLILRNADGTAVEL